MYLSDRELKDLLPKLGFKTSDRSCTFDPDAQIQPCSIDLRLDNVFWTQRRGKRIDLRAAQLLEIEPRRHWEKKILSKWQSITIKPGQMMLGRTFESFTIPAGYAGKLEGRSSFARLGLAIHCSGDFINPGYGGHMPLQLVNHGSTSITVFPQLPICQLMIIPLTSPSERVYGDRELHSKYVNDDGGPSYWWRDKRIKALHKALGRHAVSEEIQSEVLELIGRREPEVIERLEKILERTEFGQLNNSHDLLDRFASTEENARRIAHLRRNVPIWLGPTALGLSLGSLFVQPFGKLHYVFWALTAVALLWSAREYFWGDRPGEFLDIRELARIRREGPTTT